MEPEESFYGQEVVCWSCLRIAMISKNNIGFLQMAGSKTKRKAYHISVPYCILTFSGQMASGRVRI